MYNGWRHLTDTSSSMHTPPTLTERLIVNILVLFIYKTDCISSTFGAFFVHTKCNMI